MEEFCLHYPAGLYSWSLTEICVTSCEQKVVILVTIHQKADCPSDPIKFSFFSPIHLLFLHSRTLFNSVVRCGKTANINNSVKNYRKMLLSDWLGQTDSLTGQPENRWHTEWKITNIKNRKARTYNNSISLFLSQHRKNKVINCTNDDLESLSQLHEANEMTSLRSQNSE